MSALAHQVARESLAVRPTEQIVDQRHRDTDVLILPAENLCLDSASL